MPISGSCAREVRKYGVTGESYRQVPRYLITPRLTGWLPGEQMLPESVRPREVIVHILPTLSSLLHYTWLTLVYSTRKSLQIPVALIRIFLAGEKCCCMQVGRYMPLEFGISVLNFKIW